MIDQLFHPCACFICIGILESPNFQLQFFLKLEDSYTLILQIPPRQLKFISCMCTFWGPRTLKGTWEDQCWIRTFQVLGTKRNIAHSCRVRTFSGPSLRKFLGPYKVGPRTDRALYLAIYQTTKIHHSCRQICQSHGSYGKVTVASYADVDCNLEIFLCWHGSESWNSEITRSYQQAYSTNHITC